MEGGSVWTSEPADVKGVREDRERCGLRREIYWLHLTSFVSHEGLSDLFRYDVKRSMSASARSSASL